MNATEPSNPSVSIVNQQEINQSIFHESEFPAFGGGINSKEPDHSYVTPKIYSGPSFAETLVTPVLVLFFYNTGMSRIDLQICANFMSNSFRDIKVVPLGYSNLRYFVASYLWLIGKHLGLLKNLNENHCNRIEDF